MLKVFDLCWTEICEVNKRFIKVKDESEFGTLRGFRWNQVKIRRVTRFFY